MRKPNKYYRYRAKLIQSEKTSEGTTKTERWFRCDKVERQTEVSYVFGNATAVSSAIYKTQEVIPVKENDVVEVNGQKGRVNNMRKIDEKNDLNTLRDAPRETIYIEVA